MLRDEFEAVGDRDPEDLLAAYEAVLTDVIDDRGIETVADETGIDEERLSALVDGESPDLTLEEAAAVLATDPDRPDADFLVADARDILMMGMSTAVLDVEAIQSGIDSQLEAKEIQQKVEGRHPMTIAEYALLHAYIESKK
ncbi:hypothetical protein SAMN05216388_1002189 [Halorientalis persicus]|jgi:hypothetical protein|uniref:HTH cro/C1-type domain-containing protein n=1 Tax=Halorientalis persicus TaxID=1367881 RepID=A0A1H8F4E0_9EURY|nr:DUF5791 family protein [Halorientalis persicus]SEN26480.1 hypothetical protein SAMN05216388_1002189 [Halorientalis persicus]